MKIKKDKQIILSFDYELSLGLRSGTVQNCMIKPTNLILDLLKKYKLKGIFFIDTTSIMRMEEESVRFPELKDDLEQIRLQLIDIHQKGHYVYHHIHPHWLDAIYLENEKQWDLSNQSQFSARALSEGETNQLITESKTILERWIHPIDPNYLAEGYRAGGLFIEPFEKFAPSFVQNKIQYDFSVLRGVSCKLSGASYDFTSVPENYIYPFESNILKEETHGRFTEISIELIENKGLYKILNGIWFRVFYKNDAFADGKSNNVTIEKSTDQSFLSKFSNSESISFELANPVKILLYRKHIKSKEFTHFISHPKLIGPSNLKAMDKLLAKLSQRYSIESDFKQMLKNKSH